jgi:hypothetical protein
MTQLYAAALFLAAANQPQTGAALGLVLPSSSNAKKHPRTTFSRLRATIGGGADQWDPPQGPFWTNNNNNNMRMGPRVRAVDQRFSNGRAPHSGSSSDGAGSSSKRRASSSSSASGATEDRYSYSPSALDALGLKNGCSAAEVKSAYRRLVKEVHPDRDPSPEVSETNQ